MMAAILIMRGLWELVDFEGKSIQRGEMAVIVMPCHIVRYRSMFLNFSRRVSQESDKTPQQIASYRSPSFVKSLALA